MAKITAYKVTIQTIDGMNDIVIDAPKAMRKALNGFGYHFDSQIRAFRTPMGKSTIMRLQEMIKVGIQLDWDSNEVQEFARVLTL